ncbi:hypothetical protein DUZ99_03110 [Xylanibacillus composti]|uniref:Uncharacterized protein n=1 Tax=Xylanibacillus composti TaxID=1572762 RepID=A0A8J4H2R1_9BACL|nr:hypothetical protein [Xylanibacillus composti]MDT9723988.1 hypothetical protein [Xylanibacillus composti]GIQ67869.1 hypothetical protein XYCOK13_06930 [Xylanibacillus composti]
MIHIHIQNIRINSISTIGSLNIGKAVLCHNQSSYTSYPKSGCAEQSADSEEESAGHAADAEAEKKEDGR